MNSRRNNHSIVISTIRSANDNNIYLKVMAYYYDKSVDNVVLRCILKNQELTLEVRNEPLNQKQFPNTIGRLYVSAQGYIFFIDQASDNAGAF